jgi:hypothetical protein
MALYIMAADFSVLLTPEFMEFNEDSMLSDARDALAFRITYDGEITAEGDENVTWKFSGEVPVEFSFNQDEDYFKWEGDGQCRWTGLVISEPLGINPTPETAYIEMQLLFYPKKYGLSITFDNLTPGQIVYTTPAGVFSSNHNYMTAIIFKDYYNSEGGIEGNMHLENGEEEMDIKMKGQADDLEGQIEFTFKHEPR